MKRDDVRWEGLKIENAGEWGGKVEVLVVFFGEGEREKGKKKWKDRDEITRSRAGRGGLRVMSPA